MIVVLRLLQIIGKLITGEQRFVAFATGVSTKCSNGGIMKLRDLLFGFVLFAGCSSPEAHSVDSPVRTVNDMLPVYSLVSVILQDGTEYPMVNCTFEQAIHYFNQQFPDKAGLVVMVEAESMNIIGYVDHE